MKDYNKHLFEDLKSFDTKQLHIRTLQQQELDNEENLD